MRLLALSSCLLALSALSPSSAAVSIGFGYSSGSSCHSSSYRHSHHHHRSYHRPCYRRPTYRYRSSYGYRSCSPSIGVGYSRTVVIQPRVVETVVVPQTTHIVTPATPTRVVTAPVSSGEVPYREYHSNNQLRIAGTLEDGIRIGTWRWFSKSGSLLQEGTYRRGLRDGIWNRFDKDGRLTYRATYVDGRVTEQHVYVEGKTDFLQ